MKAAVIAAAAMLSMGAAQACFLTGEQISGMNKICYYNCIGGTRAITISSVSLCPISLNREPEKPFPLALVKAKKS